jgi:enoyl-CoA hydratase
MGDGSPDQTPGLLLADRPAPGVLRLRLNRPAVLNALNLALRHALAEAFRSADADDAVRVVVLAGDARAFCAGADLTEYLDATPDEIVARGMGRLWDDIAGCRKPVIAAVRGHALGGGCELAMHADLIVAGQGARFGQPEVLIGLMPGGGATQRLTRAVGKFAAMRLLLTGQPIGAAEALALGLVSEVVDDEQVEPHALAIAARLAQGPQAALRAIKEAVIASMNQPLQAGLAFERRSFALLFAEPDKREGIAARLEKRPPQFGRP